MERYIDVRLSDDDVEEAKGKISWGKIEEVVDRNRWKILGVLLGLLFLGGGLFLFRTGLFEASKIEIIEDELSPESKAGDVVVEISGAVEKPGVYKLLASERLERLLIEAGGLSADADREWVEKNLNRAARLIDGQKIYIPRQGELGIRSQESGNARSGSVAGITAGPINLNAASLSELDSLPGIGTVRAQAIIDNRPYSSTNELISKKVIPQRVYGKIKDKITAP